MAEKIVSPGVFTNENDLSFLPAGVAQIGAAFVGPTAKGPAFVPIVLRNFEQFKAYYGDLNDSYYIPYAVRNYLKNSAQVTVVRVVTEGGYLTNGLSIISGSTIVGFLLPTTQVGQSTGADFAKTTGGGTVTAGTASLVVSGSNVTAQTVDVSFTSTATNYIIKVLGKSAKGAKKPYAYVYFEDYATAQASKNFTVVSGSASASIDLSGATTDYGKFRPGVTPWVTSQFIGTGANKAAQNLFRVKTQGDGDLFNRTYKISIINNTLAGYVPGSDYGYFTLLVRDYNDTDKRPNVLETYSNLTLDPDSANYIARRIGDRYYEVDSTSAFGAEVVAKGEYPNISKLIYVEVDTTVKNKAIDPSLNPYGFATVSDTVIVPGCTLPTASIVRANPEIESDYSERAYYGWNYTAADNVNYLRPIPNGATTGSNTLFNLDEATISADYGTAKDANSSLTAGGIISASVLRGLDVSTIAKFNVPFQNGFDGDDPAVPLNTGANITSTNAVGMNCDSAASSGSVSYAKALNIMSNAETFDINLLAMPGVNMADHKPVIDKAIDVATNRGDTFVVIDPVKQSQTIGVAISGVENSLVDSNYAAAYWPWVKILDVNKNKPVWVPASTVIPGVIAKSDASSFEWFAPAGLNRGGIPDALEVEAKLSVSQRDSLYDARINPLASFPAQGVCVWGQKTLQTKPSALDRVNVRRLMITLKKYIASSTRYLVFENNTVETRQRFLNIVTPYLENVKARQGLYGFRVVMDESNNTPDIIDRNILYGQIFVQPTKTAEFIVLDFNILPTGATFDNA